MFHLESTPISLKVIDKIITCILQTCSDDGFAMWKHLCGISSELTQDRQRESIN